MNTRTRAAANNNNNNNNNNDSISPSNPRKRKANDVELNNNNQQIKSLDEEIESLDPQEQTKQTILVENLEQLYFEPKFNSDLKIIYGNKCFNLHSAILCTHSKYFYNLLENQKQPYEPIELPIAKDCLTVEIPASRVEEFFNIIYSNEPVQEKDFFHYIPKKEPLARWDFYTTIHLAHYFQCEKLEKNLQSFPNNWNDPTCPIQWYFLLMAEIYNWPIQLKNQLIQTIGESLDKLRKNDEDEQVKLIYEFVWPKLSRKTCEEIYEITIKTLKQKQVS